VLSAAGCGSSGGEPGGTPGEALTDYRTCGEASRVGEFVLSLDAVKGFTGFESAYVFDRIEPIRVPKELMKVGACRLLQPPEQASCTPACAGSEDCTSKGCTPKPQPQDVGKVTVTGLKIPLTLEKTETNLYRASAQLPHPGFDEGVNIALQLAGGPGADALTLKGFGVAGLKAPTTALMVENGKPATLTWTPPAKPGPARMHIRFGINFHGGTDTAFECDVPDNGSFTIEAALMTELFKHGVSGFPHAELTRQSADTAAAKGGCVEFVVKSPVERDLTVPGLVSCHFDDDCPNGKICADDLTCK
jgi:hypothetical protein